MSTLFFFGLDGNLGFYTYELLSFTLQLWLCLRRSKRYFPRFLPLIVNLSIIVLASVICLPINNYLGAGMWIYIIAMDGIGYGLLGIAVAWVVYAVIALIRFLRKRKQNHTDTAPPEHL